MCTSARGDLQYQPTHVYHCTQKLHCMILQNSRMFITVIAKIRVRIQISYSSKYAYIEYFVIKIIPEIQHDCSTSYGDMQIIYLRLLKFLLAIRVFIRNHNYSADSETFWVAISTLLLSMPASNQTSFNEVMARNTNYNTDYIFATLVLFYYNSSYKADRNLSTRKYL